MYKNTTLSFLLLSFLIISGCHNINTNSTSYFEGKVEGNIKEITLGEESIDIDDNNTFSIEKTMPHSTILTLGIDEKSYEIFLQPGKTVSIIISEDSISFQGELSAENDLLLSEQSINEEVDKYLGPNWYSLHTKPENQFISITDSIKAIYLSNMEKVKSKLSPDFMMVNKTALNYAFDRLVIRYPDWHYRFTGKETQLSSKAIANITSKIDAPEFQSLETYQKYTQTYLDQTIEAQLSNTKDTDTYEGEIRLKLASELISDRFNSPALKDFWTWKYVKAHVDQYTWINGKQVLSNFKVNCSTPEICSEAEAFERELLEERKGHDISIYKSVKGYKLEAHIFKPENFDNTKTYPALAAFHGGGWMAGHASWTFESAHHAAQNGLIGVAIEYRLSNQSDITPVEAMHDTRDAIRWLRKNADSLNINPNKIVAKGLSAGGHLVSAISVIPDTLSSNYENAIPNALVLISPAIDTRDDYFIGLLQPDVNPGSLSAYENLKPGLQMPPTLLLQGKTDRLTPTVFAEQFKAKMDSLGYTCQLKIYEGCGHLFTPSHLDDTGMPKSDPKIVKLAYQEQTSFLKGIGYVE